MSQIESQAEVAPRHAQGVLSNFLSLLAGTTCVQLVGLAYLTYAARVVGPDTLGVYSYIMAFTTLLTPIVTFGRQLVIARETAISSPERQHHLVQEAWHQHLWIGTAVAALFCIIAWWIPGLKPHFPYVVLITSTLVLIGPAMTIAAYFQGVKRMAISSLAQVVQIGSRAVIGVALLLSGFKLTALVGAFVLSSVIWSVYSILAYRRHSGHLLTPARRNEGKTLLRDGGQIVLGRMTSAAFNRFDWILLGSLKASTTIGVYSIAYRVFEFCTRVPGAMVLSVFPTLCAGEEQGRDIQPAVLLAMKLAMLPGCVVVVFALCWAEAVFGLLLPAFRDAGLLLVILSIALPFHGAAQLLYHLTIAKRRQRLLVWTSGATAIANVALCLVLIPPYGSRGAAIAMVVPSFLQFWLLGAAAQQTAYLGGSLWYSLRATAITGLLAGVLWVTPLPWIAAALLAAIGTPVVLWFGSGFTTEEKAMIRGIWRRFTARLPWRSVSGATRENDA